MDNQYEGSQGQYLELDDENNYLMGASPIDDCILISQKNILRIYDLVFQQFLGVQMEGHKFEIIQACYNSDGKLIASCGYDKDVIIWNSYNQQQISILKGHKSSVNSVCFSVLGNHIVTCSEDGTARVWSCNGGEQLAIINHAFPIWKVSYLRNEFQILCAYKQSSFIWDTRTGQKNKYLSCEGCIHIQKYCIASFARDQTFNRIRISSVKTKKSIRNLAITSPTTFEITRSLKFIVALDYMSIRIWDLQVGKEINHNMSIPQMIFCKILFLRDDERFLTLICCSTLRINNLNDILRYSYRT